MADLLSSLQHIYQSWDRKCHQGKRPAMSEDKKVSTLGLRAYSAAKRTAQKQFEESNTTKVKIVLKFKLNHIILLKVRIFTCCTF